MTIQHIFLLISMIFLHIVDDYYLQGKLALFKQKKWWQENYPKELYKNDYLMALFFHSFSWSFMIMLPLYYYCNWIFSNTLLVLFIINIIIHFIVDNLKANKGILNLVQDQLIHLLQIIISWFVIIAPNI